MATPLAARAIIITRTDQGNKALRRRLELLGARVIEFPAVRIEPPKSWKEVDGTISGIEEFDWVVFTSSNGAKYFVERLLSRRGNRALNTIQNSNRPLFACVGPETARTVEMYGLKCALVPKEFLTERLGEILSERVASAGRVLLARSEIANNAIERILTAKGATVINVSVYRTTAAEPIDQAALVGSTDIIFASPSAVRAFSDENTVNKINSGGVSVHCIGPVTSKAAIDCGMKVATVSEIHTIDGLIDTLVSYVSKS